MLPILRYAMSMSMCLCVASSSSLEAEKLRKGRIKDMQIDSWDDLRNIEARDPA